jgi:hypothetical protein
MVTLGGGWKLNKYDEIRIETAFSKNDLNLFSDLDAEDDKGNAYKVNYKSTNRNLSFMKDYKFNAEANYEYNSADFSFIDRVRYIEFDRDWSYNPDDFTEIFSENIVNANLNLSKVFNNKLSYQMAYRKRGEAVNGFQHTLNAAKMVGKFLLKADLFNMTNDQIGLDKTQFGSIIEYKMCHPRLSISHR